LPKKKETKGAGIRAWEKKNVQVYFQKEVDESVRKKKNSPKIVKEGGGGKGAFVVFGFCVSEEAPFRERP